ncbi:hypothetical protein TNIN_113991 [Trichonephila inaurata madagascariensis]|uniref:Uncharacterized protein n=1 Tax=Trichonephila inaurata madagascariensis TaxID=2747483 RepID=A0A8X6X8E1_9ARAC|nr:hypothetical protein TNIN_113951 [Trichonephila inaurata madagascariensis]GFY48986.1 hypothetical protein TNIN_113991 [Trichonephila inaurata madagascariensis]
MGSRPREDFGMIHASEGSKNGSPGTVWGAEPKYEITFKKSLKVCRLWPEFHSFAAQNGASQKGFPGVIGYTRKESVTSFKTFM